MTSTNSIMRVAYTAFTKRKEVELLFDTRRHISSSAFSLNFNGLTEGDALLHFRFRKQDIIRMIEAISWPSDKRANTGNIFSVTPLLANFDTLCRLASPARWKDLEILLGGVA